MGVPPHWMSYIAVAERRRRVQKIKTNGGTSSRARST
jgi:hypothetical protein